MSHRSKRITTWHYDWDACPCKGSGSSRPSWAPRHRRAPARSGQAVSCGARSAGFPTSRFDCLYEVVRWNYLEFPVCLKACTCHEQLSTVTAQRYSSNTGCWRLEKHLGSVLLDSLRLIGLGGMPLRHAGRNEEGRGEQRKSFMHRCTEGESEISWHEARPRRLRSDPPPPHLAECFLRTSPCHHLSLQLQGSKRPCS